MWRPLYDNITSSYRAINVRPVCRTRMQTKFVELITDYFIPATLTSVAIITKIGFVQSHRGGPQFKSGEGTIFVGRTVCNVQKYDKTRFSRHHDRTNQNRLNAHWTHIILTIIIVHVHRFVHINSYTQKLFLIEQWTAAHGLILATRQEVRVYFIQENYNTTIQTTYLDKLSSPRKKVASFIFPLFPVSIPLLFVIDRFRMRVSASDSIRLTTYWHHDYGSIVLLHYLPMIEALTAKVYNTY